MVALSRGEVVYFKKLEDFRIDHDLSQQEVADYLGCQREVYRRYEKGTRSIPVDFLIRLADLCRVSVDELLDHKVIGNPPENCNSK